jgi:hypothetical protein
MSASHNNEVRSRFITATIAALLIAVPSALLAQGSPLTVQPSTGRSLARARRRAGMTNFHFVPFHQPARLVWLLS